MQYYCAKLAALQKRFTFLVVFFYIYNQSLFAHSQFASAVLFQYLYEYSEYTRVTRIQFRTRIRMSHQTKKLDQNQYAVIPIPRANNKQTRKKQHMHKQGGI